MLQSLLRLLALPVLGVFLVAPAHAAGDKDKSPEDIFKAFAAAMKKEDAKVAMSHLSRDSQSAIAGFMLIAATSLEFDEETKKQTRKPFEDLLKRHGISSDDALRKIPEDHVALFGEAIGREFPKNLVALGEMVREKPAFVADVLKIMDKHPVWEIKELTQIGEAKIKDIKIEGEQAKGRVTIPSIEGKERTVTYYLKMENGVWMIDAIETYRKMPPPPRPVQAAPQVQPQATPSYSRPGPLRRLLDRLFDR
jgi:hypothetical protein